MRAAPGGRPGAPPRRLHRYESRRSEGYPAGRPPRPGGCWPPSTGCRTAPTGSTRCGASNRPRRAPPSAGGAPQGGEPLRPRPAEALAAIQHAYPALGARYRLQEDLRLWLQAPARPAAAAQRARWLIHAEACDHAEGYAGAQTVKRWRPAIRARWDLGRAVTNGFIEGGHTKIKAQKRLSYGFRHRDRYRRKIRRGVLPPTAIPPLLTSSPEGLDGLGASYYNNANLERQILASARSGGTEFWGESASAVGRPARIRQLTSSARGGLKVFVMSVPHFGKVKMGLGHFLCPLYLPGINKCFVHSGVTMEVE